MGIAVLGGAELISLSPPRGKDQVGSDAPAAHLSRGSSRDQSTGGGPAGSERFVLREHVPDGGAELTGDLDPRDLRSALAAETLLRPLVALAVGGGGGGGGGGPGWG